MRWLMLILLAIRVAALEQDVHITRVPIGMAYASTAVNVAVFRCAAVASAGAYQFAAYYDPNGHVVVARRKTGETAWDSATLDAVGNVRDAHNVVVLGISSDGIIHLSYDQHGQPLHYRASLKPWDVHSFGAEKAMTGQTERRVTYPQFVSGPHGELYFFYRDGASGNGSLCVNRYDAATGAWEAVHHPLIDGLNRCNPYWWRPAMGADGSIHLAWCWRDRPDAETNHDICYAVSRDGAKTWQRSDGTEQLLPITPDNAEVIEPVARGSNLINQCSGAVDGNGRPHFVQYMNDAAGVPQYFQLWFDGTTWQRDQVSNRTVRFSIGGSGSLAIPISRPEIAIAKGGVVYVMTRDAELGGGIRLYHAVAPYRAWEVIDLTRENLGNWEPSYDLARWRRDGVLSLFVMPAMQGNHERTTDYPAQEAEVLETTPP